jgi:HD-GYP domain-containing protein (c-di-GMP phosphodiesterase class II)
MDYESTDLREIMFASLLYDVGVGMMPEKTEDQDRYYFKDLASTGLGIIGDIPRLKSVCEIFKIVDPESEADESVFGYEKSKDFAEIIDIADRVAHMLDPKDAALNQVEDIVDTISDLQSDGVSPSVIEAFLRFSDKEYVWMEVLHQPELFLNYISDANVITLDETIDLSRFISRIIDFRSNYTAMHSSGVAATAVRLAEIMGMSEDECKMMMIAGYLHDIGKLKVPNSILEKMTS